MHSEIEIAMTRWSTQTEQSLFFPIQECIGEGFNPHMSNLTKGISRKIEYILPVSGPIGKHDSLYCCRIRQSTHRQVIGPKQTKVKSYEEVVGAGQFMVCVNSTSETPDVPSGNAFNTSVRVCMSHHGPNRARLRVHARVDFNRYIFVRSVIETSIIIGIRSSWQEMDGSIRDYLNRNPRAERLGSPNDTDVEPDGSDISDEVGSRNRQHMHTSKRVTHFLPPNIDTSSRPFSARSRRSSRGSVDDSEATPVVFQSPRTQHRFWDSFDWVLSVAGLGSASTRGDKRDAMVMLVAITLMLALFCLCYTNTLLLWRMSKMVNQNEGRLKLLEDLVVVGSNKG